MKRRGSWYYFSRTYRELTQAARRKLYALALATLAVSAFESLVMGGIGVLVAMLAAPGETSVSTRFEAILGWLTNSTEISFAYTLSCLAGTLLILLITKNFGLVLISKLGAQLAFTLEMKAGERLMGGLLSMPYQWHSKQNSSDLYQIFGWRRYLGKEFLIPALTVFSDFTMVLALVSGMLFLSPMLSGALIVFLGTLGWVIFIVVKSRIDHHSRGFLSLHLAIARLASLTLHGVRDIKISGAEKHFTDTLANGADKYVHHAAAKVVFSRVPSLMLETVGFGLLMIVCVVQVFMPGANTAQIAGFLAMIAAAAWRILPACNRIIGSATQLRHSLPYIERVYNCLDMIAEHGQQLEDVPPIPLEETLMCDNLSFSYEGSAPPALKDISLCVRQGESIGIIGSSGAGKSTLVDIICGLQQAQQGSILLNGDALDDLKMRGWRKSIGYVAQAPYIFDGTLAENVAFRVDKNIDLARVEQSCKHAAIDFIEDLPEGYSTAIGEKGTRLSGGQRQRVAIARALYRSPSVLIFDEATSALDSSNERLIQSTLNSLQGSITLIIVAHRLSTVKGCDIVLWLDRGEVKMLGPARQVLAAYEAACATRGETNVN